MSSNDIECIIAFNRYLKLRIGDSFVLYAISIISIKCWKPILMSTPYECMRIRYGHKCILGLILRLDLWFDCSPELPGHQLLYDLSYLFYHDLELCSLIGGCGFFLVLHWKSRQHQTWSKWSLRWQRHESFITYTVHDL